MSNNILQTTLHKITTIDITQKAIEYGFSELDLFKLIFGLETEFRASSGKIIEPHFTFYYHLGIPLTAVGIFEPGDWRAQVCICMYNELQLGQTTDLGRELLYPRQAHIAATINLIKLSEMPYGSWKHGI